MSACYVPDTILSKKDTKINQNCMLDTTTSFLISFLPFFLPKRISVLLKVAMFLAKTHVFLDFLAIRDDNVTQFCPMRSR